jgi:hypothetical protein
VSYALLPEEKFWPEGKRAGEPCRFQCDKGCGIHEQPRPKVCGDFHCSYIRGHVPQRPDESGAIFAPQALELALRNPLAHYQAAGRLPGHWQKNDIVITIAETRPEALLSLDPEDVRQWFARFPWRMMVVIPSGFDVLHDLKVSAAECFMRIQVPTLGVWWKKSPAYADRVYRWWTGADRSRSWDASLSSSTLRASTRSWEIGPGQGPPQPHPLAGNAPCAVPRKTLVCG